MKHKQGWSCTKGPVFCNSILLGWILARSYRINLEADDMESKLQLGPVPLWTIWHTGLGRYYPWCTIHTPASLVKTVYVSIVWEASLNGQKQLNCSEMINYANRWYIWCFASMFNSKYYEWELGRALTLSQASVLSKILLKVQEKQMIKEIYPLEALFTAEGGGRK